MQQIQPDDAVGGALMELGTTVAEALPRDAVVKAPQPEVGGYYVEVLWPSPSVCGRTMLCRLALHFTTSELRAYCDLSHTDRACVCRRIAGWLNVQLELQEAGMLLGSECDSNLIAPSAFFCDGSDVACHHDQKQKRGLSLYLATLSSRFL